MHLSFFKHEWWIFLILTCHGFHITTWRVSSNEQELLTLSEQKSTFLGWNYSARCSIHLVFLFLLFVCFFFLCFGDKVFPFFSFIVSIYVGVCLLLYFFSAKFHVILYFSIFAYLSSPSPKKFNISVIIHDHHIIWLMWFTNVVTYL